ncbi:hypothetical protein Glove_203g41 [Diversispora epigaea]|uniref:Uncharacterized protein n=1 Tax=Diversispora epigaea TaxID=1348612 RepID=A0A397IMT4_9GLOM|nr:hypothetical protein Glove_203g41 [Diversispora epigaea]
MVDMYTLANIGSGGNQIRLNTYENYGEYNTYSHKDWGFTENDNWNNQNGEKLQSILQEFIGKNINYVYCVTYQCVVIFHGGINYADQYEHTTQPPFKLRINELKPEDPDYEKIKKKSETILRTLEKSAKDWGFTENDNWNNQNGEKLQSILQEFIGKNINYVYCVTYQCVVIFHGGINYADQYEHTTQPPFKLRINELKPEDPDYEKIKKKSETILRTLEKSAV